MSHEGHDVAIIGAGIAGLAASVLLRTAGLRVVCLDPRQYPQRKVGESLDWSSPGPASPRRYRYGRPPRRQHRHLQEEDRRVRTREGRVARHAAARHSPIAAALRDGDTACGQDRARCAALRPRARARRGVHLGARDGYPHGRRSDHGLLDGRRSSCGSPLVHRRQRHSARAVARDEYSDHHVRPAEGLSLDLLRHAAAQ